MASIFLEQKFAYKVIIFGFYLKDQMIPSINKFGN